ncbi:MAG: hypothetical protein KF773_12820 [Deltaproteobacteria bacterium]|nr:hypothetical protein [Deltaproteobacteria bacterium]MCW5801464.1 hypothetical protein [Deltaproteobacteria bacterium]
MRLALWLSLAMLAGCAHDVHVRFPAPPDAPTGTLVILLSKPASGVTVAINGILVAEDRRTGRVTVSNVPTGTGEVTLTANGGDKQFRAWVDGDHVTTVPIGVSEPSLGFLKSVLGSLISIAAYSLLL